MYSLFFSWNESCTLEQYSFDSTGNNLLEDIHRMEVACVKQYKEMCSWFNPILL